MPTTTATTAPCPNVLRPAHLAAPLHARVAHNGSNITTSSVPTALVRAWARAAGHDVGARGRLPARVREAWTAATIAGPDGVGIKAAGTTTYLQSTECEDDLHTGEPITIVREPLAYSPRSWTIRGVSGRPLGHLPAPNLAAGLARTLHDVLPEGYTLTGRITSTCSAVLPGNIRLIGAQFTHPVSGVSVLIPAPDAGEHQRLLDVEDDVTVLLPSNKSSSSGTLVQRVSALIAGHEAAITSLCTAKPKLRLTWVTRPHGSREWTQYQRHARRVTVRQRGVWFHAPAAGFAFAITGIHQV